MSADSPIDSLHDAPPGALERIAVLEKRLQLAEARLENALEELDVVTSVINHDLRSPLVSVMGFAAELRFLATEMSTQCNVPKHELDEAVAFVESGAKRMGYLLDEFSALGALRRRPIHLAELDTQALAEQVASKLGAGAVVEVRALPHVSADVTALQEILTELLGNSLHSARDGIPLQVVVEHEPGEHGPVLLVTDNGRGIPAADQARIFRPFVRLTPHAPKAEGLGLTRALTLARRMGGNLRVQSEPGRTTFRLEL